MEKNENEIRISLKVFVLIVIICIIGIVAIINTAVNIIIKNNENSKDLSNSNNSLIENIQSEKSY